MRRNSQQNNPLFIVDRFLRFGICYYSGWSFVAWLGPTSNGECLGALEKNIDKELGSWYVENDSIGHLMGYLEGKEWSDFEGLGFKKLAFFLLRILYILSQVLDCGTKVV